MAGGLVAGGLEWGCGLAEVVAGGAAVRRVRGLGAGAGRFRDGAGWFRGPAVPTGWVRGYGDATVPTPWDYGRPNRRLTRAWVSSVVDRTVPWENRRRKGVDGVTSGVPSSVRPWDGTRTDLKGDTALDHVLGLDRDPTDRRSRLMAPRLMAPGPMGGTTISLWRRGWDSNPRDLATLRFSRAPPSTARPPLRRRGYQPLGVGRRLAQSRSASRCAGGGQIGARVGVRVGVLTRSRPLGEGLSASRCPTAEDRAGGRVRGSRRSAERVGSRRTRPSPGRR